MAVVLLTILSNKQLESFYILFPQLVAPKGFAFYEEKKWWPLKRGLREPLHSSRVCRVHFLLIYSSTCCLFKVFFLACECLQGQMSLHCSWQRCYCPVRKPKGCWSLHSSAPALVWSSYAYKEPSRLCVSVLTGCAGRKDKQLWPLKTKHPCCR